MIDDFVISQSTIACSCSNKSTAQARVALTGSLSFHLQVTHVQLSRSVYKQACPAKKVLRCTPREHPMGGFGALPALCPSDAQVMSGGQQVDCTFLACSWKANILCEELGIDYKVHPITLSKNEQKEDWFLKINPNGRIPAIGMLTVPSLMA